jgi:hypothetical protein
LVTRDDDIQSALGVAVLLRYKLHRAEKGSDDG